VKKKQITYQNPFLSRDSGHSNDLDGQLFAAHMSPTLAIAYENHTKAHGKSPLIV
jgi:hypothetical protein